MENLEVILSLAITALSLLVTCVTFAVKLFKKVKENLKNISMNSALSAVAPLVELAETFANYSGEEKKEFVLTKVNQYAIENGLEFNADKVSEKIEELISLSKQVNKRN